MVDGVPNSGRQLFHLLPDYENLPIDVSCIGLNKREHMGDRGQIPYPPVTEGLDDDDVNGEEK